MERNIRGKIGVPYSEVDMKTSFALLCVLAFALPTNAQKVIDGKWESHFYRRSKPADPCCV